MAPTRFLAGLMATGLLTLPEAGTLFAQSVRSYCAAAKKPMAEDNALRAAARAVFPAAEIATRNDECLFPVKVLSYGDADALIVAGGAPGEACHGCAANLSAYVLRAEPGRQKLLARFVDFTSSGTFGDPGRIEALQLAGNDAFAIEAGGMFQGYSARSLSLFIFRSGRLAELKPALPLDADNGGAVANDRKAISVKGLWRVDPTLPGTVTITYTIRARGRERRTETIWTLRGNRLSLSKGRVPPEYAAAGGGG